MRAFIGAIGLFVALYVLACVLGMAFKGCAILPDYTCVDNTCEYGKDSYMRDYRARTFVQAILSYLFPFKPLTSLQVRLMVSTEMPKREQDIQGFWK